MTITATRPRTGPPVAREDTGPYRTGVSAGHDGAALGSLGSPPARGDGAVTDAPATLEAAVGQLDAAIAALAEAEVAAEPDEAVRAAAIALPQRVARIQARLTDLVGEIDRRQAHEDDGAVTVQSWFRARVNCNPGEASQLVAASRRLRRLPRQQPLK